MNVFVLPGFLNRRECEETIALFPSPAPATVNGPHVALRKCEASFLAADTDQKRVLIAKVHGTSRQVNRNYFHFDLVGGEPLQLASYGVGDYYGQHLDIGPGVAGRRKLSMIVQLTDPAEYDGGSVEMWGSGEVDREQGALIVFPSYLVHEVHPITRGVRKALVAWMIGSGPYR